MSSNKELALVGALGVLGGAVVTVLVVNLLWNNMAVSNVVSPAYGGLMQCCGVSKGDYCLMGGKSLWRMPNYSSVDCDKVSLTEFRDRGQEVMAGMMGPETLAEMRETMDAEHVEQMATMMGMMHYGCRGMPLPGITMSPLTAANSSNDLEAPLP